MIAGIGGLVFASLLTYLLFSGWLYYRVARRMEHIAYTERTRGVWAEAREKLLRLAIDGKIDVQSQTFQAFYGLQTYVMRRPDAYEEFSRRLANVIIQKPKTRRRTWADEQEQWPAEMADVLALMGEGTQRIALGYASGRRILARFALKAALRLTPWLALYVSRDMMSRLRRVARRWTTLEIGHQLLIVQRQVDSMRQSLTPSYA